MDYFSLYLALYLVGFAALHSLLVSLPAKRIARRHFGSKVDPWYPRLFSAIAVITILPLVIMLIRSPGPVLYVVPQAMDLAFLSGSALHGNCHPEGFPGRASPIPDSCPACQASKPGCICSGDKRDLLLDS